MQLYHHQCLYHYLLHWNRAFIFLRECDGVCGYVVQYARTWLYLVHHNCSFIHFSGSIFIVRSVICYWAVNQFNIERVKRFLQCFPICLSVCLCVHVWKLSIICELYTRRAAAYDPVSWTGRYAKNVSDLFLKERERES